MIQWSVLDLSKYLSNIDANNTDGYQYETANQPDAQYQ